MILRNHCNQPFEIATIIDIVLTSHLSYFIVLKVVLLKIKKMYWNMVSKPLLTHILSRN